MPALSTVRAISKTWGVREYILASVKRDFVAKYLGTQLGWFWAVAQPLAMIVIYTLVFAEIMRPSLPGHEGPYAYSISLCAGILLWQLFSEILSRSVGVFVQNGDLLKKVSLPKPALPAIVTLTALTNFVLIFTIFLAFLALIGKWPGWAVLAALPVVAVAMAIALGLGVLLGTLNVFYRDIEQTLGIVVGFWFWLTPIVYPARALPAWLADILEWNPVWPLVHALQVLFLEGTTPSWSALRYPAALAAGLLVAALLTFRRLSADMVDEL
jgi:lipopolysaccharide transport system permease protein